MSDRMRRWPARARGGVDRGAGMAGRDKGRGLSGRAILSAIGSVCVERALVGRAIVRREGERVGMVIYRLILLRRRRGVLEDRWKPAQLEASAGIICTTSGCVCA